MNNTFSRYGYIIKKRFSIHRIYELLARRAYTVIVFCALFCILIVKFYHSWRYNLVSEYYRWILADVSVLLGIEVVLAIICFRWPYKVVIRAATTIAALVCTWSVMNTGWLIRTGTQILPAELLPLFREPVNVLWIVGVSLIKMPRASVILLLPSVIVAAFVFSVLAGPRQPKYNHKRFLSRTVISIIAIIIAVSARIPAAKHYSSQIASLGLQDNCHLRAIVSLVSGDSDHSDRADFAKAGREIPAYDQIKIALKPQHINHNVVIVVLEGIQYNYTSLGDKSCKLTPYLATLADNGVEFRNARSTVTHTTKALFALLAGRFPSASQDIAETIPVEKPYAGIASIVGEQLNYRTAFFQSAKGNFESRPGLVYNLGFNKFWARDDLNDPNSFVGYLASDEFSMLEPIAKWIKAEERPFLLTVLCSVTHDPYEVPQWFAKPAKEPIERYRQAIIYTDNFLAALDVELAKLNLADKTILCVIGDHGEAFGEHGLLGHERIAFEEVLRIPWIIRAPFLVEGGLKVNQAVGSVDLTPTLLSLLGFNINVAHFDGVDVLENVPERRKVYFAGWMQQGPAGFIDGTRKFTYSPVSKNVYVYDLSIDPLESARIELPEQQVEMIVEEIVAWQKESIFRVKQQRTGKKVLFDSWLCNWAGRVSTVKYKKQR
jgi:hypothetical protein